MDILFENETKKKYLDSLKNLNSKYKISVRNEKDSDLLEITVSDKNGNKKVLSKLVNNRGIRNIYGSEDKSIDQLFSEHDVQFRQKNNL